MTATAQAWFSARGRRAAVPRHSLNNAKYCACRYKTHARALLEVFHRLCFRVTCLPSFSSVEDAGARGDVECSREGPLRYLFVGWCYFLYRLATWFSKGHAFSASKSYVSLEDQILSFTCIVRISSIQAEIPSFFVHRTAWMLKNKSGRDGIQQTRYDFQQEHNVAAIRRCSPTSPSL